MRVLDQSRNVVRERKLIRMLGKRESLETLSRNRLERADSITITVERTVNAKIRRVSPPDR